ncbi:MAG TPA: hypothetical protein VM598_06015 [Bdellovibrionota bacterium]|nr:hypothetical protein [Bdellovibrionota bacterium]
MLVSNLVRGSALAIVLVLPASVPALADQQMIGTPPASKGQAFNPAIGVNMLGLFRRGTGLSDDRNDPVRNGLAIQEAELQIQSDVDPYLRAVATLAVHQEEGSSELVLHPEELYLETLSLPRVTIRAGRFWIAMGKHNQLHTHAFPFIDAPLINQALLSDEGLGAVGLSAATLLPTDWYSELIVQGFDAENETLYSSPRSGDIAGLVRLKNLFDLTDDLTMDLGVSATAGKNAADVTASVWGADLTFKWRPSIGGRYRALIWTAEYLRGRNPGLGGGATWLQYQFAERWWAQARAEVLGLPDSDAGVPDQNRQSALVGFFPSEFSGFRLQYDRTSADGQDAVDHAIALQFNISIGAHPAHAY